MTAIASPSGALIPAPLLSPRKRVTAKALATALEALPSVEAGVYASRDGQRVFGTLTAAPYTFLLDNLLQDSSFSFLPQVRIFKGHDVVRTLTFEDCSTMEEAASFLEPLARLFASLGA